MVKTPSRYSWPAAEPLNASTPYDWQAADLIIHSGLAAHSAVWRCFLSWKTRGVAVMILKLYVCLLIFTNCYQLCFQTS